MRADRYVGSWDELIEEFEPASPPEPDFDTGVYCSECEGWPFVLHTDIDGHDRWHVERAARLDPAQATLGGEVLWP